MKFKYLIFHFLTLILLQESFAQNDSCRYLFRGNVVDGETGLGFSYAYVFIQELQKGVVTDEKGNFSVTGLCQGKITLLYSALGYKSYKASYKVRADLSDKIILHTDTCELQSVTVYGERPEELSSFTKSTLSGKELERSRGLSLGDALSQVPGVSALRTGNSISKPVIHGLHSNRVLLLNAGLRQEGQQWGNEHAPEIDPFVSDSITVIKGAAGVMYGSDAIAGVVITEPRRLPGSPGVGGQLNLIGMSNSHQGTASGLLEGMFGKFPLRWRVQGTLKKAGNTKTPFYYQDNTGFEEQNFSYSLGHAGKWLSSEIFYSQFNTSLGIYSGAHIGSLTDLQNAIERSEPSVQSGFSYKIERPFQHIEHELTRVRLNASVSSLGKIIFTGGRQFNDRSEYDVLRSSVANQQKDIPQLRFKLTTLSADIVFEHKPVKNFKGNIGTSYMRQSNIWQGRFLIPNFISKSLGGFALERWSKNKFELEAGIRYDIKLLNVFINTNDVIQNLPFKFSDYSGTIGGNIHFSGKLVWKTSLGTAWRAPNINELFSKGLHHGAAAIESGRSDLKPEKAFKAVSSAEIKGRKLNSDLTLFFSNIHDFIYLKPDLTFIQTIKGAFPSFTYTQINAYLYGADVFFHYELSKSFSLSAKGSLVFARNMTENTYLINIPPVRYNPSFIYSPAWIKKEHASYFRLSFSRTEYQNRVPENTDYADPPEAYTLTDAEIGFDVTAGKQKITVIFQVSNIFNIAYRDYMNRFRYYTDETGRNLTFKIKVPFHIYKPSKPSKEL